MTDIAVYREVPGVDGLQVNRDGLFMYNGKPKKPIQAFTVTGRRATVRVMIMIHGKTHYWQAAKLVAQTWLPRYYDGCCVTYVDGDCHNICADNLRIASKKEYTEYLRRNAKMKADTLEERKRKLKLVSDQALMTLHYFETLDMSEINNHVKTYLYPCLMRFAMKTLQFGERKAMDSVTEAIGSMYERIMDGMCLYNYERYCKKILHDLKKKNKFGEYWWKLCKPIKIEVESLNLDCLWERYKVTKSTK